MKDIQRRGEGFCSRLSPMGPGPREAGVSQGRGNGAMIAQRKPHCWPFLMPALATLPLLCPLSPPGLLLPSLALTHFTIPAFIPLTHYITVPGPRGPYVSPDTSGFRPHLGLACLVQSCTVGWAKPSAKDVKRERRTWGWGAGDIPRLSSRAEQGSTGRNQLGRSPFCS